MQIFRSIDSNSVKEISKGNVVCGKNVLIDMSIHTTYVKAIPVAHHYIYVENQSCTLVLSVVVKFTTYKIFKLRSINQMKLLCYCKTYKIDIMWSK
ncbi:phospholipase D beta, putative [Medicago truncatula]|uniref:Phospholipase D beta, putative n=1 Tax=Medicago truncatula TaxID=3880 RepID=G8A0L5_MEDTR|nr:phospholipase D beta, putative [Medicago truncatula]